MTNTTQDTSKFGKSQKRWNQWSAGCYRDKKRTKHFRVRQYFTREWYISGAWSCGWDIGLGFHEIGIFWGITNEIVWELICEEED